MPPVLQPSPADRPRERLVREGPAALTTVELIAILLGTGGPGRTVIQVADALHDGTERSLRRLSRESVGNLIREPGVGRAKAARLVAALELGSRLTREIRPARPRIGNPEDVVRMVGARLRDLEFEEFHTIVVTTQRDVIKDVLISRGTLDGALVHPREVFRPAIAEAGAAVVLVHNHPSGDPTPSPEDLAVTARLVEAGRLVGIPVLDHLIVGSDRWVSFATQGLL